MDSIPEYLRIPKDQLTYGPMLGSGASGAVFKGMWRRADVGLEVAIKMMSPQTKREREAVCNELRVLAAQQSSYTCGVYGGCFVSEKVFWLVLEYANEGDLYMFLASHNNLPFSTRTNLAQKATTAAEFLHSRSIVHRDIKSRNFLVQRQADGQYRLLLSDFGSSKATSLLTSRTNTTGTLKWAAPEVLGIRKKWSEKSDVYSLGMVIYEIFSGNVPFHEVNDVGTLCSSIASGIRPNIQLWPQELAGVVAKCWVHKPKNRPTASELLKSLNEIKEEPVDLEGTNELKSRVLKGDLVGTKALIELGANVDSADSEGRTVVHFASHYGYWQLVKILRSLGANMKAKDNKGRTALHWAADSFIRNETMINFLSTCGIDVNATDNKGRTALHLAAIEGNWRHLEPLKCLGINIDAVDATGKTALHLGTTAETVKVLLELGANMEAKDGEGQTALQSYERLLLKRRVGRAYSESTFSMASSTPLVLLRNYAKVHSTLNSFG